jgi:putative ABC transport system permease protein
MSYVLAAALTLLFAVIVNLIGHYQMRKISMVESLKTNE